MRIIIIRHGDPDYERDSLTERGWKEAKLLSERLAKESIQACYLSPLGRAQDTASVTLEKMNMKGTTCEWLREFAPRIHRPDVADKTKNAWDWLPEDWTKEASFYDRNDWKNQEIMKEGAVGAEYEWVTKSLDELIQKHGYRREKNYYRVEKANHDTIVFFCHFGVEMVLLSHLIGAAVMPLWHGFCAAPSSVTEVYTEERREGIASFRIARFGDISHLYVDGVEPSFQARFCETFDSDERHD